MIDWVWIAENWQECFILLVLAVGFVLGVWRLIESFFWPWP